MPRRRGSVAAGIGWGPTGIILFLLIASLFALAMGKTLIQLATRIAIVAAIVGFIYLIWHELAIRNPAFRMGTASESTIVLLLAAVGLIFLADPIATSAGGLVGFPGLSLLSLSMGPVTDVATQQLASWFLFFSLIALSILLFSMLRKRK